MYELLAVGTGTFWEKILAGIGGIFWGVYWVYCLYKKEDNTDEQEQDRLE